MDFKKTIQQTITDYKESRNLTRSAMARELGIPPTTLQAWEEGNASPNAERFVKLLALTGAPIENFKVDIPADRVPA